MPQDIRDLGSVVHPLRNVWRAFVDSPRGSFTIFVEAHSRENASAKAMQAAKLALDSDGEKVWVENLSGFDECFRDGSSHSSRKRLFETGWNGETPVSFVGDPMFLVSPTNLRVLVDAFASIHDKRIDQWQTLSRHKAIESLADRDLFIARRFGRSDSDGRGSPLDCLRRSHVGRVHVSEKRLEEFFGRSNKTVGEVRAVHWALSFDDGIVVHIYRSFFPGERKRHDTAGDGIWDVSSYRKDDPDLLEIYGLGRVTCLLCDLELRARGKTVATVDETLHAVAPAP